MAVILLASIVPVIVGDAESTTEEPAVPVEVVVPVPPFSTGRAVPDKVIAKVPDEVIGEPDILRNAGTEAATEVTVPTVGVVQDNVVPLDVSTWLAVPTVVRPVPPFAVGSAVPDKVIAKVPDEVIGEPDILRNA
jgi:hypothetical protein